MEYPAELVARAKYEVEVFERVSADTGIELIAEVVMLRSLVREMRTAASAAISAFDEPNCKAANRFDKVLAESLHSVPEEA